MRHVGFFGTYGFHGSYVLWLPYMLPQQRTFLLHFLTWDCRWPLWELCDLVAFMVVFLHGTTWPLWELYALVAFMGVFLRGTMRPLWELYDLVAYMGVFLRGTTWPLWELFYNFWPSWEFFLAIGGLHGNFSYNCWPLWEFFLTLLLPPGSKGVPGVPTCFKQGRSGLWDALTSQTPRWPFHARW